MWRLWCKALGEKSSNCNREADRIAFVRTLIFLTYLVTNIAIVANAIRHWNDGQKCVSEVAEITQNWAG